MWLGNGIYRMVNKSLIAFCLMFCLTENIAAEATELVDNLQPLAAPDAYQRHISSWRRKPNCSCSKLSRIVDVLTDDVIDFHKNIFTMTSLKVLVAAIPVYLITRPTDKKIHSVFYCSKRHKNLYQPPQKFTDFLNYGLPVALLGLSSLAIFSSDDDLATAARVFAIGLPFVWIEKNILKSLFKIDACKRPFNQNFPKKCVYGGCPSGHMAFAWYATIFWGSQQGLSWGIPMGIFSTAVFIDFVMSNRHYASQMVLGAALGIIYGFAGSKAADIVKNLPITCGFGATDKGGPALEFSYSY